jgi:cell shape-determining protein MreC
VTSGVNSLFPTGIPIGEVIDTKKSHDGLNISARIRPYVSMDSISKVVILRDDWSLVGNKEAVSATLPAAMQ